MKHGILSPLSRIKVYLLISPMGDLPAMAFLLRPIPSGMLTNMQQKTSQTKPRMLGTVDRRLKGRKYPS
jgi:hypothetical protein